MANRLLIIIMACAIMTNLLFAQKKALVVYFSKTGNTERVALDIASRLGADLEKINDKKERSGFWGYMLSGWDAMKEHTTDIDTPAKDPSLYDIVIIGTPVWAWQMAPAVRTYIIMNKGKFKSAAYFVTAGGTGPDKIVKYMEDLSSVKAAAYTGFTRKDLKDEKLYNEKLNSFVASVSK